MSKGAKGDIKDDTNYIIYLNIEGMCVPLTKMLKEIKDMSEIKLENFFPYVDKTTNTYGYFLKQPNNSYKQLSQANWRSILHGQISNLRPKENMPDNNRIKVLDKSKGEMVEICYWPDSHYESQKKTLSKKKEKNNTNSAKEGGKTRKRKSKTTSPVIEVDENQKTLTSIMDNALKHTSFDFLIKEPTIEGDEKKQEITEIVKNVNNSQEHDSLQLLDELFPTPIPKESPKKKKA